MGWSIGFGGLTAPFPGSIESRKLLHRMAPLSLCSNCGFVQEMFLIKILLHRGRKKSRQDSLMAIRCAAGCHHRARTNIAKRVQALTQSWVGIDAHVTNRAEEERELLWLEIDIGLFEHCLKLQEKNGR